MSIELQGKKNPVLREEPNMSVKIYAFESNKNRIPNEGETAVSPSPFAYITTQRQSRDCSYRAPEQEVAIIKGIVRGNNPQVFHKEVRHRAFDGLLTLPFFDLRYKLTERKVLASVYATREIKDAAEKKKREAKLGRQKLVTG
jgi:hypothetical protein